MSPFVLAVPSTEAEALALVRPTSGEPPAILAGGTDLLLDLDQGRTSPTTVVSLRRLPWREQRWDGGALRIGSTRPLRELETDEAVRRAFPALAEAIAAVGSPALRRQATLGGNLGRAAPASDLLPVLLALDAEVELIGEAGARSLPVDRFLRTSRRTELRPGELIRAVRLPEPRPSAYLWQRVRPANDISQVAVAAAYSPSSDAWRVALGGVPPRPILVPDAADELAGPRPGIEQVRSASRRLAAHPGLVSDRRATEEYRRQLVAVLLRRAVERSAAAEGGAP
jgi:CO/xanthine dehydrogenase FAD-binding subunit